MIKWLEKMLDRKADSERRKWREWNDKNAEEWKDKNTEERNDKNAEEWVCTGNKNENKNAEEWKDKNAEEWICTVRVLAAPGWSGKMTLGELADLCGTARNRDEKVPMRRVR